jgi:dipeptidyl aminopeptidase/acylaminoacyl peptidase
MVLLVHGGPWAQDVWGYSPEVQLLANRGYAVLQVNYRGSTGYGKSFTHAAEGEFGRKMHDDLVDAVAWAVGEGIADPARVAIYGGSYGGYAALCGVTLTPDLFAAAVSYVGPSSLVTLIRSFPAYWRPFLQGTWFRYVGDPGTEEEPDDEVVADLLSRSPLSYVDRITTPLMVVQGANDPRVTKVESDQIVAALRARGVDVEYLVKDDEGHGFANPENRLDLYRAMEAFLARHLGGRVAAG